MSEQLRIDRINSSGGTQARAQTDWTVVAEYAQAMEEGASFPPVVVFFDGTTHWLADGFHRVAAAKEIGCREIVADIRRGEKRDAILFACGANASHGARRTNADKRRAVMTLLEDEEWGEWSNYKIAQACAVDEKTVRNLKEAIYGKSVDAPAIRLATRNGTTYEVNTANIGRREVVAPSISALEAEEAFDEGEEEEWAEEEPAPVVKRPPIVGSLIDFNRRMAGVMSSETPEHYTPQEVVKAAIACMGGIDLDPCSNSHDSPNVPAATHYTREDDGLAQAWLGTVYMNPPYGREIGEWVDKLVSEFESGNVTEAIALVPARTDTQWFQRFRDFHFCLVKGRLTFIGNDGPAPFPSAIVYLGHEVDRFINTFEEFGDVFRRTRKCESAVVKAELVEQVV